jgi:putative addiction module antidote
MALELKLRKIGNSAGVIVPKEVLARLHANEGESIFLTETTDGDFLLTAFNPAFAHKMKVAKRLSRRYRHALKDLED